MSATTYSEAMASTPKPIRAYPGFATVDYTPSVGLSARPRRISVLLYNGTEVSRGTRSDHLAVLGHQPTRERFIAQAGGTR